MKDWQRQILEDKNVQCRGVKWLIEHASVSQMTARTLVYLGTIPSDMTRGLLHWLHTHATKLSGCNTGHMHYVWESQDNGAIAYSIRVDRVYTNRDSVVFCAVAGKGGQR
jgi:hypothetical protein